jgi:ribosome-associated protein
LSLDAGHPKRFVPNCNTTKVAVGWSASESTAKMAVFAMRALHGPILSTNALEQERRPIADAASQIETRRERSLQLAFAAARTADDNRGQDIAVLDMRGVTPEFDFFVLATGNSRRQLHAISEEIDRTLEADLGDHRLGIEGYSESRWILLDYGSVVIHLFDAETRNFYALEDLWSTAERVPLPWEKI